MPKAGNNTGTQQKDTSLRYSSHPTNCALKLGFTAMSLAVSQRHAGKPSGHEDARRAEDTRGSFQLETHFSTLTLFTEGGNVYKNSRGIKKNNTESLFRIRFRWSTTRCRLTQTRRGGRGEIIQYFVLFPPFKSRRGFLFKSVFVLYYQKAGREVCQTSKKYHPSFVVSGLISRQPRVMGTERREAAPQKLSETCLQGQGFPFGLQDCDIPAGLSSSSARRGREMRCGNGFDVCPHPSGRCSHPAVQEQQGCQLCSPTRLLFLKKKLLKSQILPEAMMVLCER